MKFMDALLPQTPPVVQHARQVRNMWEPIERPGPRPGITSRMQKRMQEMHAAGATYADIGKVYGISHVHARRMVLNIVEIPHPKVKA